LKEAEPRYQILIVEDDVDLADLLSEYLNKQGFAVSILDRGEKAVSIIISSNPDLVILDIMLPGKNGIEILRELRNLWKGPVLMLTALKEDTDVVVGLELGADDYVGKPVSPRVLLAKIRALLRRHAGDVQANSLVCGRIRIDLASREVYVDGKRIDLTSTEFDLLALLAKRAGRVQRRSAIVEELRGIDFNSIDRSVDVIVSRLRRKLGEDPVSPRLIKTIRSVGYVLVKERETGS
jgi:two-component system response regulator RstA